MSDGTYTYPAYEVRPDPSHRPLYLDTIANLLKGLPKDAKILDAGCGGGDFAEGLAARGFNIYGCDLSTSGIKAAQARGCGVFLEASLYESLTEPFGVDAFDAIISIEVVEHLYSPKAFAQRAMEALKPGSLCIVTTPYWGYFKNLALAITNRTDRSLTALWEGGHIKHFSRSTLTTLMEREGFECLGFSGTGETWRHRIPYLWSGMLMIFRKPASRT